MKKVITFIFITAAFLMLTLCTKSVKTDAVSDVAKTVPVETDNNIPETVTDNMQPGNNVVDSGIKDIQNHSGQFNLSMSGYKGEIFIGIADGRFYGTIKFFNWGNGVPQPLTDLRVTDDKIYFRRVIKTKEDLIKYGGTAYFEQDFYGIFTADKKTIRGYYRYIGTQDNWEAVKKTDTDK